MVSNMIFCLNATVPLFLLMLTGYFLKKKGMFTEDFNKTANTFVFKIAIPFLVFQDLSGEDFSAVWNGRFVLFCFIVTVISIAVSIGTSFLFKDKNIRGEFSQASYRSSSALLGISFIHNIYGTSVLAPMMIIGSVPLYNAMAVVILSFMKPDKELNAGKEGNKELIITTFISILKNPIIHGIALGLVFSLLKIKQPVIMQRFVNYISVLSTPLGLLSMGAAFNFGKMKASIKAAALGTFMKLVLWCGVFLTVAIMLGYRNEALIAVLVMCGSPTTVACYAMAERMGHEGYLTASIVMLTSIFSAFTLTLWLFIMRSMGWI